MPPLPNTNSTPYPTNPAFGTGGPPPVPFGAGYFPPTTTSAGTGYPPSGAAPFGAGYPPAAAVPFGGGYPPSATMPYAGAQPPPATMPFGAGFVATPSSTTGYTQSQHYPQLPNPCTPNIPNASYPKQQHYIPQTHSSAQGYSGYCYQQAPTSAPVHPGVSNMAASFAEMQGHIRDVRRSKVCVVCVCVCLT